MFRSLEDRWDVGYHSLEEGGKPRVIKKLDRKRKNAIKH
jgi:hypothetical protein